MFKLGFSESNFTRFGKLTINKLSWIKDMNNKYLENLFKTEVIINYVRTGVCRFPWLAITVSVSAITRDSGHHKHPFV